VLAFYFIAVKGLHQVLLYFALSGQESAFCNMPMLLDLRR
jgi:hypothetical protein